MLDLNFRLAIEQKNGNEKTIDMKNRLFLNSTSPRGPWPVT